MGILKKTTKLLVLRKKLQNTKVATYSKEGIQWIGGYTFFRLKGCHSCTDGITVTPVSC